jgi:hypothetical protein
MSLAISNLSASTSPLSVSPPSNVAQVKASPVSFTVTPRDISFQVITKEELETLTAGKASPLHAATPTLHFIALLTFTIATILVVGGIYLAFSEKPSETDFEVFGNTFSSTSIGLAMAFLGACMFPAVIRRLIKCIEHLASIGKGF